MQKTIKRIDKQSKQKDKKGRVKGYFGTINQWQNSENKSFYAMVKATRDGASFGASQPQIKFTDFDDALEHIEKVVNQRIGKLDA